MRIFNQPAYQRGLRANSILSFVGDDIAFTACQLQQRAQILRVDKLPGELWGYKRTPLLCRQGCRKSPVRSSCRIFQAREPSALYANGFGGADAVPYRKWADGKNGVFSRFAEGADRQLDRSSAPRLTAPARLYASILRVVFNHTAFGWHSG